MWNVILALLLVTKAVSSTTITGLDFHAGSRNGGTLVRISGSDFAQNSLSNAASVGNKVYFCSQSQCFEANVQKDGTDETTITVETTAMTVGTYRVKVEINGQPVPDENHCSASAAACQFHVYSWYTPLLYSVSPATGTPTTLLTLSGRFYTSKTTASEEAAPNGNTAAISRVWVGGKKCALYQAVDELYGVRLYNIEGTDDYSNWGEIKCLHTGHYVACQNVSIIIDSAYGRSLSSPNTMKVSSDYRLCNYQTYAVINSVTPTTGSIHGGTLITVNGNYLDDPSIEVTIGGEKCEVDQREETSFTCKTSPKGTTYTDAFPGGRGVIVEVYAGLTDKTEITDVAFEDYTGTGTKSRFSRDTSEVKFTANSSPVVVRLRGFFIPAKDGTYTFSATGDSDIYVSTDQTMDNKAASPGALSLVAGAYYYYEVVHTQATTIVDFKLTAFLEETDYNSNQTVMAKEEQQNIITSSPGENEIQTIQLNNWEENPEPVNEVFELCIKCLAGDTCSPVEFTILLDGKDTAVLLSSFAGSLVKWWIDQFPALAGDTVTVEKSDDADAGTCNLARYVITIDSTRGSIELLSSSPVDSSIASVEISRTSASQASLGSFSLAIDGHVSGHVTVGDTNSLTKAVKSIFGTSCPPALGLLLGVSSYFNDFESGTHSDLFGGTVSPENSFCGSNSLKNPLQIVFEVEHTMDDNSQLCFAYNGSRSGTIQFDYKYIASASATSFTSASYEEDLELGATSWEHTCISLYPFVIGSSGHVLTRFSLSFEAADDDFFIDNVFLGTVYISQHHRDVLETMRRLPLHNTLRLDDVVVQEENDRYTVEMTPVDCGIDFPILEIAYATASSGVYTDLNWGGSSITVQREQESAPPIGGTFTLNLPAEGTTYGGTLSGIPWNAEGSEVEARIEELNGVSDAYVTRSGTCRGYTWTVNILKPAGRHKAFTAVGSFVNTDATIATNVSQQGGLYLNPIPGDWLRAAHTDSNVEVIINNVASKCEDDCSFSLEESATPSVTDVQISGSTATITGAGFSTTVADNTVQVGGVACTVTTADESSIACTIGESPGGEQILVVNVKDKGNTNSYDVQITMTVTGITPTNGNIAGSTRVTLTGIGLSSDASILIGDSPCTISASSYTSITCITGPSAAGPGAIAVTDGIVEPGVTYTFETPAGAVTSLDLDSFSVLGGSLVITGTGFGTSNSENSVYFGTESVEIVSWTDTEIRITAPSLAPGVYPLRVYSHPAGDLDTTGYDQIAYVLEISAVTPDVSSLLGGIDITITGSGFEEGVAVKVGDNECEIKDRSTSSITCTMASCGKTYLVDNTGTSADGTGYAWNPGKLTINAGDQVAWSWSELEGVTGASYQVFSTSSSTGVEFGNDGFNSGTPTDTGGYVYRFNVPGKYYYGGLANSALNIFMRGVITVVDPSDVTSDISVTVGEHTVTQAGGVTCQTTLTPTITGISPKTGTSETAIIISGTGFSGSPTVTVGDATCTIEDSTDTSITCKVGTDSKLPVGIYQEVAVSVTGKGIARSDIRNLADRSFVLLPFVSSVSPSTGSIKGKTTITITGGGFTSSTVINDVGCAIVSQSYTEIQCETHAAPAGTHQVEVNVPGVPSAECTGVCTFEYRTDDTPTLTTVDPTTVSGTVIVTITGAGFTSDEATVMIGSTPCEQVTVVGESTITCSASAVPVGEHTLELVIPGKGAADPGDNTFTITSESVINSVSPETGSVNGGTKIDIAGNGFVEGSTTVAIGDGDCLVLTVTPSNIECRTPASSAATVDVIVTSNGITYPTQTFEYSEDSTSHVTAVNPSSGETGDSITLTVTKIGNGSPTVSFGGIECPVTSTAVDIIQCTLGSRYGGSADIVVDIPPLGLAEIDDGVEFSYAFSLSSIIPSAGSLGGGQEVTVSGSGIYADAVVTICDKECVKSGVATATSVTCVTPSSTTAKHCDVKVANTATDVETLVGEYEYSSSLTPIVTTISPTSGGTGGGTTLTITGSNLAEATEVTIDGVECVVSTNSGTVIVCATGPHTGSIETKVEVHLGQNGIAPTDNTDFHYIDRWSSIFTWGGTSVPQNGEYIVIEAGQTILFDTTSNKLSMLLIQGGKVIFEEKANEEVHLHAENILITDGGLLQIGTAAEPYMTRARITMHGHLRSPELPIYGAKTLGVRDGKLEMHGKPVVTTWTLLERTAIAGETELTLQMPVHWSTGDSVVIASTGLRHSQEENEERTIQSISADGRTITLTEALDFDHLGDSETYTNADGKAVSVDYRAEIGLLSRNIVFEGSDDKTWNDTIERCPDGFDTGMFATQTCFQGRFGEEEGADEYGGSIMIHSPSPTTDPENPIAEAHIEYVELTYVGQAFRLGRYPIHWHLMGDMRNSYVRGCALHKTFNRAVTIHGTHNLLVERNVIYNVMGGAFFIEDGIETGNIIQYNLAVFVKASTSLLNDDITPACFWVTNPNNTLQHNHAAGGTHFGFWYRMHEHPDGPSFTDEVCQRKVELGVFKNNTVHSQGWFGLWIFRVYKPVVGGSCGENTPMAAKFSSLTAWHCEKGAEWVDGSALQFHDFVLSSNEVCGIDLKLVSDTEWDKGDRGALIKDNVIIGESGMMTYNYPTTSGIIMPFGSGLWIDGVDFFNLNGAGHSALSVTEISGTCTTLCGGFYYLVERITFTNSPHRVRWRWEHEGVIYDLDGSFTGGQPGSKVVPYSAIYGDGDCVKHTGDLYGAGYDSSVCEPNVRFHRFAFNHIFPTSLEFKVVTVTNSKGAATSQYLKKRMTHKEGWMFLLRGAETYDMEFDNGAEQFTNLSYTGKFYDMSVGDYIIMRKNLTQKPDRISLFNAESEIGNSVPVTTASANRDWHYDENTRQLTYMVTKSAGSRRKRQAITTYDAWSFAINLNVYRCFYTDCKEPIASETLAELSSPPDGTITVTELTTEGNCMEISPLAGGTVDVTIPTECSIRWAIPETMNLNALYVKGALLFDESVAVTIRATYIVNEGYLIAGWAHDEPHTGKLRIILRGNHATEEFVTSGGQRVKPKALACFGTCDLHGRTKAISWTRIEKTADAGTNTLVLKEEVTWNVDDEIVIAPSGFNAWQTEKNTISAISGKTITLKQPLTHSHVAHVGSYTPVYSVDLSAEVGLLTKSISIESEDTAELLEESFGAWVLVTTVLSYNALGRFSNVEFYRSGQEGFYDDSDPRHSITFLYADRKGEVLDCAFHDGFSPAIGSYGTDYVNITGNVVHHTVNEGIVIKSTGNTLHSNLVVLNIFRGSYQDRFEIQNFDYTAAINVESSRDCDMRNNVVVGAERVGYRISGQACDTELPLWSGNEAKATLVGLFQRTMVAGTGACSLVNGFLVYKAWDFGHYLQTTDSVDVRDCKFIDCTVGFAPLIVGPNPLTHETANKNAKVANSLFVGRSGVGDCDVDMDEVNDQSLIIRRVAGVNKKAPSTPSGGRTGIFLPLFAGSFNGATFKSLIVNMNYPAIYGGLYIEGVTVANFGDVCDGKTDRVFYTNPQNEDISHPTYVKDLTAENVNTKSYLLIDRPSTGKINPADCVDMSCDAMRQILIKFENDSLLGESGYLFAESEWQWGGATVYGLGDYRIPKPMLTDTDGTRITVGTLAPNGKGIARDGACQLNDDYQAYKCDHTSTNDYIMLVIESLDEDTETRRLSPVALLSEGYIDLVNGPQDHGWCSGYTCQKRISTFYAIVPLRKHTDIYFTSTPPKNFRLHLVNPEAGDAITVAVWIPNPQKMDVHDMDGSYMPPLNAETQTDGTIKLSKPPANDLNKYRPLISSHNGDNFLDYDTRMLYMTVQSVVEVKTTESIIVAFGFPTISVDEFFGPNIVNNIATLLGIPQHKIRRVNVVSETTTRRRKRNTDIVTETVEISATNPGDGNIITDRLTNAYQTNTLTVGTEDPVPVSSLDITPALDDTLVAEIDRELASDGSYTSRVSITVPTKIVLVTTPAGEEKSSLTSMPTIHLLDGNDNLVVTASSWTVQVDLDKTHASSDDLAQLDGTKTLSFSKGVAQFTDLKISHSGTYMLTFTPTGDAGDIPAIASDAFVLNERTVSARIDRLQNSELATEGADLKFDLQLVDGSNAALQDITFKGYTYKIEVSFDDPSMYGSAALAGTTVFDFDSTTGQMSMTGLSLSGATNYHVYNLKFRLFTEPASNYDSTVGIQQIQIYPTNVADYLHHDTSNQANIVLKFASSYDVTSAICTKETLETAFHNDLTSQYPLVYFSPLSMSRASDGNVEFRASATSNDKSHVDSFVKDFTNGGSLRYGSHSVTVDPTCGIAVDDICYGETVATTIAMETTTNSTATPIGDDNMTTVIVFAVLGACVFVSLAILVATYIFKRYQVAKVGQSPINSRASSSLDSFHMYEGVGESPDYPQEYRMTPVTA